MQIIPIASGKGGVGKSLLAANLSIALAQSGNRVILADLDLGGSNLHLILGIRAIPFGIGTFLTSKTAKIASILIPTEVPNLRFVPGDSEIPGMANLKPAQKRLLIRELQSLDADYLILDLGAGTGVNTIDFFLMSSHGIIVTTPTLTATLNAYFFLKNAIFRILHSTFSKGSAAEKVVKTHATGQSLQKLYIPKLMDMIREADPNQFEKLQNVLHRFQPRLVFNMLDDPKDVEKANKVRRSTREYLGVDMEHLGVIYRDELQDTALNSRLPIVLYKPHCVLSQAIYRISEKITMFDRDDLGPLDMETLEETHQLAAIEAEADFDAKLNDLEELVGTGALTMGDLVEAIRSQQFELNQVKKENLLLKSKMVKAIQQGFKV